MRLIALASGVFVLATACSSSEGPTASPAAPSTPSKASPVQKADDGSLRVPFAGGFFATWNEEMPNELVEAAGGQKPGRPVVVWAGNESAREKPAVWGLAE